MSFDIKLNIAKLCFNAIWTRVEIIKMANTAVYCMQPQLL